MKRYLVVVSLLITSVLIIKCEEDGIKVIGSRDHDITSTRATKPEILANGISTTNIIAKVHNKDGSVAPGMKVNFETTAGIIEEDGISNVSGNAQVTLTSVASDTDLTAKITAVVVDTTFSPLTKKEVNPFIITLSVPGFETQYQKTNKLEKTEQQQDNRDTVSVKFLGVTLQAEMDETILPADGLSQAKVEVRLRETTSFKAIENAEIFAFTNHGSITGSNITNQNGNLEFFVVSDDRQGDDTLRIEYGNKFTKKFPVRYENPIFTLTPKALQAPADGESRIPIVATLLSHRNTPIKGAVIKFSTTAGIIPESAETNENGNAIVDLVAANKPDSTVNVMARFHSLKDTAKVSFVASSGVIPNSIILNADPNFIWVKETGNIDQTIITATVLGINNQPVGNDIGVKFYIVNGPGGETIEPSSGSISDSTTIVPTVNGISQATIRSGTRSGTVKIKAKLVGYPKIQSQTTNIVIRSGPPYMWLDSQKNNVVRDTTISRTHATLAVECGKHNVAFANPIQDIQVTAYFGDKYNNPVEEGTAVYFTTTGGIITSDAITNNEGQTSVILKNVNPFPTLVSRDTSQRAALTIRNPNDESRMLDIDIPDFEYSEVKNSKQEYDKNDGVAVILAYTWGQDQEHNPIKVWTTTRVVFSEAMDYNRGARFSAYSDSTTLGIGHSTNIYIRLYDFHGNPVAAGSRLTASANSGELSETDLLPSADRYGFGRTYFIITLTNTLKPGEDEATTAVVKIALDSPNGTGKIPIPIYLRVTP